MVYASNNEQSFTDVKSFWQNEVEQYSDKSIGILLLGNKMDLED
jgi:GTPase SAR1 family protein